MWPNKQVCFDDALTLHGSMHAVGTAAYLAMVMTCNLKLITKLILSLTMH
jgi:hypothetical protein